MFNEYFIAKNVDHPNVVEYKYFMRKYDNRNLKHEFHIVMELINGVDMEKYLEQMGRPPDVEVVRTVGR